MGTMGTFKEFVTRITILYFVLITHSWATILQANETGAARWITDGSEGFVIDKDVVTYTHNGRGDNMYNAMWQEGDGISSGKHYWKIHFPTLNGGKVGFTSKGYFRGGYCNSIQYLGNLSNGSGRLVGSFGPNPKQGDIIGILAIFEDDRLKVYIDVNGASLGLAFDVPASTFTSIYPIVSFRSSGSATCAKQTDIPNVIIRTPKIFTGIEGDWQLTYLSNNNVELCLFLNPTANIKKIETDKYSLHYVVVNVMWSELLKVNDSWKTSRGMGTYIGVHGESIKLEHAVSQLFEEVKMVEIGDDGNLHVKSGDGMASTWNRYDAAPGPFVGDPFSYNYRPHRNIHSDINYFIVKLKCFIRGIFK